MHPGDEEEGATLELTPYAETPWGVQVYMSSYLASANNTPHQFQYATKAEATAVYDRLTAAKKAYDARANDREDAIEIEDEFGRCTLFCTSMGTIRLVHIDRVLRLEKDVRSYLSAPLEDTTNPINQDEGGRG